MLGTYQGIAREWLYWYDESGQRLLTPEERIQTAEQNVLLEQQCRLAAEQKAQILAQKLRELGIDKKMV